MQRWHGMAESHSLCLQILQWGVTWEGELLPQGPLVEMGVGGRAFSCSPCLLQQLWEHV